MSIKKPQPEDMELSPEEDAEGEEEEGSGSESSSDDDEFDSTDDRVNMIPGETSETLKFLAQEESSEDSQSSAESEKTELALKAADSEAFRLQSQQITGDSEKLEGSKTFDSDVESEYETESSSESEDLTAAKDMMNESTIDTMETSPRSQKKVQKDDFLGKRGMSEDDQVVKKGKEKASKQQQKDPPPSKTAKTEMTQQVQEENQPAKKGQGGAMKQLWKNDDQSHSVKPSSRKRKLKSFKHNGETDSADSTPIAKKRNNTGAAHNAHIGKMGTDRDKPAHALSDTGKEIARKTLSDPTSRGNGLKGVVSRVEHQPKQEKKSNSNAIKRPASPQKQKKSPHVWSTDEEITMASEVLKRVEMGLEVPSKKGDDFWLTLSEILQEKLGVEFSREQLSEKVRRMKQRYQSTALRIKESRESHKQYKHKNASEQRLFDIWSQIWGRAEVTSLEDHEDAANDVREKPSKAKVVVASTVREDKSDGDYKGKNVPKMRPSSMTKSSKKEAVTTTGEASEVDRIAAVSTELDKGGAAEEDHGKDGLSSPADGSGFLSKDVQKLLHDKIHASLCELQEWSKRSMEEWMNKALALIENSVKMLGDQARCTNGMGNAGGGLAMRICNPTEFQFVHGEQAFQQQWYELHLRELNIYAQRLELMQKECELKQEQLKLQLQLERDK